MARGYIYHIVSDPDDLGSMAASDFYDDLDALCVEYTEDSAPETAQHNTNCLARALEQDGFVIRPDTEAADEGREAAAFVLETGDQASLDACRRKYFGPLLAELKKEVAALDLDTFSSDRCNTYSLTSKINDDYGDAVYLNVSEYGSMIYTMHGFIRRLDPNTTYYVAQNTVLMH